MNNEQKKEQKAVLVVPSAGWLFGVCLGAITTISFIALFLATIIGKCK